MSHLLLILILFGDPSAEATAKTISNELSRIGGAQVQVVIGADALKLLEARGVKDRDLLASPGIATHLTSDERDLVVIHLDHRVVGGDEIVESRIWSLGHADSHVAIAGHGGDPASPALAGILQIIGPRLPVQPGAVSSLDDNHIAALAERADWPTLTALLQPKEPKNPREWYYLVMALVRQEKITDASIAMVSMRSACGTHFLVKAAESLLPPVVSSPPAGESGAKNPASEINKADDGNVLRDGPVEKDDAKTNVLR